MAVVTDEIVNTAVMIPLAITFLNFILPPDCDSSLLIG
jgi:hypothetical protein